MAASTLKTTTWSRSSRRTLPIRLLEHRVVVGGGLGHGLFGAPVLDDPGIADPEEVDDRPATLARRVDVVAVHGDQVAFGDDAFRCDTRLRELVEVAAQVGLEAGRAVGDV